MQRRKDFDPQAIPRFDSPGRLGELDPDEPEERQSSSRTDPPADAPEDDPSLPSQEHADQDGREPLAKGSGALDGLVGAP